MIINFLIIIQGKTLKVLVYRKCSTCLKALKWLEVNQVVFDERPIKEEHPSYEELKAWYEMSGLPLKKFFNTSGILYKQMNLKDKLKEMSEDEQLKLLATDGMLVKRPLVIGDGFVLTGFKSGKTKSMVREITKDIFFLGQKSEPATEADIQTGRDLQDTLKAHRAECVGMAANMIGIKKNVIIVNMGIVDLVMFNPVLLKKSGPYETEEGCLSLTGVRKTTRYREIEVEYRDMSWTVRRQKLSGWTAQICQHEMDHLKGIII